MNIISLNTIVRVTLTEQGRSILVAKAHRLYCDDPICLVDHVWEAPLWKVMNMFGEYLHHGMLNEEAVIADGGKMKIIKP